MKDPQSAMLYIEHPSGARGGGTRSPPAGYFGYKVELSPAGVGALLILAILPTARGHTILHV